MSKKNKKLNENIKCDVTSCNHNDNKNNYCELDSISVSCTCDADDCTTSKETVCESFESNSGTITDTEYEVTAETEEN